MPIASDLFRTITVKINDISQQLPYIVVNQADDNGKIIRFVPLDHGQKVTGFTGARLYYPPRSDNTYGDYVTGVESDGAWDFTIPVGVLNAGRVECNLAFIDSDGETYSRNVVFLVEPAVSGVYDPGDGQQTRLDKVIGTVQTAADTAIGNINQTVDDAMENIGKAEESISKSVTDARASADAAAKASETNAAASATAAQQAVDGFGLEVGTTTTGEPGTDAAVEIQKAGAKYTANFTIPRGNVGPAGVNENVPLGSTSGVVAQAKDAYPALPRKVQVHGRTVKNLWPAMSAAQNGVTFNTDETGLITISGTKITGSAYAFKNDEGLAAGKTYVGIVSATVANLQVRLQGVLPHAGSQSVIGQPFTTSGTVIQIPAGTTDIKCVFALEGLQGQTVNSSFRVMLVEGDTVPDAFVPSGVNTVKPEKLVVYGKSEQENKSEANLPSDISLADGDTLTIDRDGTTQIIHAEGEPTVLENVTLPQLPAPTFNVYTAGGYIPPIVDVDYEQDINIVINKLEQAMAVQAATMKINQLTD